MPLFMISCGGGGAANIENPKIVSFELGEMKGRAGHESIFPLHRRPSAGKVYAIVTTKGDVSNLVITVTPKIGAKNLYKTDKPNRVFGENLKKWMINIDIPAGDSSLQAMMVSSTNKEYFSTTHKIVATSIDIKLSRSYSYFTAGPNTVTAIISNNGHEDSNFLISATDNYEFVSEDFTEKNVSIKKGESVSIDIPVNLPKILMRDFFDYKIEISAKNINSKEINIAKMDIDIKSNPVSIPAKYKSVILNTGNCADVPKDSATVEIVIVGSEKLFLNKVDVNSIFLASKKIRPLTTSIVDKVSFSGHVCDDIKPDGLVDLVMTFSLQDIIGDDSLDIESWLTYISYHNIDNVFGDIIYFTMKVGG